VIPSPQGEAGWGARAGEGSEQDCPPCRDPGNPIPPILSGLAPTVLNKKYPTFVLQTSRHSMKKFLFIAGLLLAYISASAQSLTGTTGYFNIPSGELYPDKTMYVGASFLNKKYVEWSGYEYTAMPVFVTATFLPFMEISIRYTRALGREDYSSTVGDRMASARFRPLKEGKYWPSVVIGFQNFFTTLGSGEASHFNSTYIVATKNFKLNKVLNNIGLTAGYGSEVFTSADYQFIGLFGGMKFSFNKLEFIEWMVEYDADKWNAGARLTLFKHLVLLAGFEGMEAFSWGVSYRFNLP
jgi:hypothetical protein